MKWNYRCPLCGNWRSVDWTERDNRQTCDVIHGTYVAPSPAVQRDAYVDTHEWPWELEQAVVSLKGRFCIVPGCLKPYETLDHRVAWSKGGRTSVVNLYPMCNKHNESKGDSDYWSWLATKP